MHRTFWCVFKMPSKVRHPNLSRTTVSLILFFYFISILLFLILLTVVSSDCTSSFIPLWSFHLPFSSSCQWVKSKTKQSDRLKCTSEAPLMSECCAMEIGLYLCTDYATLSWSSFTVVSLLLSPSPAVQASISISLQVMPTHDWEIKCSLLNTNE